MIEISLSIGQDAFAAGSLVYVWCATASPPEAIYVGETSRGIADRTGLHLRLFGNTKRSGAEVAALLRRRKHRREELIVLAFPIPDRVLKAVIAENRTVAAKDRPQMARRAIERLLYDELLEHYPDIYPVTRWKGKATSAKNFTKKVVKSCIHRIGARLSSQ